MRIDTLEDLYLAQLKELHSAQTQALDITKKLTGAASGTGLVKLLTSGAQNIRHGVGVVEKLAHGHRESLNGARCPGMEGLVKESQVHGEYSEYGDDAVKDTTIITQFQRIVHYIVADYGSLASLAERLELVEDAHAFTTCVETASADVRAMIKLAKGGTG